MAELWRRFGDQEIETEEGQTEANRIAEQLAAAGARPDEAEMGVGPFLSSMRGKETLIAGVDQGMSDRTGFSIVRVDSDGAAKLEGSWTTRTIPLWCPFCGKPHVDRGEWAKRPHHKHLCHDDEHGKGCGKLFRIGEPGSLEYVFGAAREHESIEKLIAAAQREAHEAVSEAANKGDIEALPFVDTSFARLRRALRGAP